MRTSLLLVLLALVTSTACATVKRTCHAACDAIPDEKAVIEETAERALAPSCE